jgi:hypothetical protein
MAVEANHQLFGRSSSRGRGFSLEAIKLAIVAASAYGGSVRSRKFVLSSELCYRCMSCTIDCDVGGCEDSRDTSGAGKAEYQWTLNKITKNNRSYILTIYESYICD